MKTVKRIGLFLLVAVFLVSIAACGSNSNDSSKSTADQSTAATSSSTQQEETKKPVKLSFSITQTGYKDFYKDVINNFHTKFPYISVDAQVVPDNQFENTLKVKFAASEAADVITVMSGKNMKNYNYDNFLAFDGTEPWVSRLSEPDKAKHDGKIMGFKPARDAGMGILYNKDVFEKYSLEVPTTYDEFLKVCETLKNSNITPVYFSDKDTWTLQIWLTCLAPVAVKDQPDFWKNINSNKQKFTDSKELEDILSKQLDLVTKGYINKDHMSATYDMANKAMAEGKAGMYLSGAFALPEMQKINPNVNIGMFAIPFINPNPDIIAAGNLTEVEDPEYGAPDIYYAISEKSKNVPEAKEFINFLSLPENVAAFCKANGQLPNFKDVTVDLGEFNKEYSDNYSSKGKEIAEMNGRIQVDLGELWNYEQGMLAGAMTPKQVLQAWDKKFDELCKAKGIAGF